MSLIDIVVGIVILSLVVAASWYVLRNKKRGGACTGCSCCPLAERCDSKSG
nr:FeoB-associated Cys-rich membrane protein [uncultured Sphaerochaeta sp.]